MSGTSGTERSRMVVKKREWLAEKDAARTLVEERKTLPQNMAHRRFLDLLILLALAHTERPVPTLVREFRPE